MTDILKFKVELNEFEDVLFREIEISESDSVSTLVYAVMSAFSCFGCKLFAVEHNTVRYETELEDMGCFGDEKILNPAKSKIYTMGLNINDAFTMEYDYGADWLFKITLIGTHEAEKDVNYPIITRGKGKGIIEDSCPEELHAIIKNIDETGECYSCFDYANNENILWDYKDFDLSKYNKFLHEDIEILREQYE